MVVYFYGRLTFQGSHIRGRHFGSRPNFQAHVLVVIGFVGRADFWAHVLVVIALVVVRILKVMCWSFVFLVSYFTPFSITLVR